MSRPPLDRLQVFADTEPHRAAWNMAVDEALLRAAAVPVVRFYRWTARAVTFGYSQPYAAVARRYDGWDMTRRWTGGGVVEHGSDLTYTLAVPASDPLVWRPIGESYAAIHLALAQALVEEGYEVAMSDGAPGGPGADACFQAPVRHDLVRGREKVAGAAQRRCRHGLLHQGSVLGVRVGDGFQDRFARLLAARVEPFDWTRGMEADAARLERERYGTEAWVRRR